MTTRVMRCAAVSHYFHRLEGEFPSIDGRLAAVTRERYRRIDRFVQLTLMGAAECARRHVLSRDCGLYLSSGVGPITSNVLVQDAIHRDSRMPMPFSFVNTLGSSACYHVAKELELAGEAVMVARGRGSFSAALTCAQADLESGIISQVLVGAVEECVLPADRHRALLRMGSDVTVAEGTHWILLERYEGESVAVDELRLENQDFDGYESRDAARITSFVAGHDKVHFGIAMNGPGQHVLVTLA
ncbi:MAG: beta-ketoacyl synthase N-terminal-like domain-containing protein [Gemmatimonadaceae bacterium]